MPPEEDSEGTDEQMGKCSLDPELVKVSELLDEMMGGTSAIEEAPSTEGLGGIAEWLELEKASLQNQRTARLWMQYMNMVDILRKFIKAGYWELNLQVVHGMLPHLASSGPNSYANSAYMYLQMMNDLPLTYSEVYRSFQSALHVVRRSDRYWAGLSSDLVIERSS